MNARMQHSQDRWYMKQTKEWMLAKEKQHIHIHTGIHGERKRERERSEGR